MVPLATSRISISCKDSWFRFIPPVMYNWPARRNKAHLYKWAQMRLPQNTLKLKQRMFWQDQSTLCPVVSTCLSCSMKNEKRPQLYCTFFHIPQMRFALLLNILTDHYLRTLRISLVTMRVGWVFAKKPWFSLQGVGMMELYKYVSKMRTVMDVNFHRSMSYLHHVLVEPGACRTPLRFIWMEWFWV